ncbi:hypothetical protein [Streptomyces sp. NBC_00996]|uniref:hypothetical protein n=1 Tax=Streptomyces sp. NBC_00996 TaxID=2903710 RepID=UPI00386A6C4C|nr:hypothetical protein OG390_33230 [Streptomyces sp. NBC_00996]
MKDAEILARFDGRGRAEFLLGGFEAMDSNKITAMAFEFGYDLQATEVPSKSALRLIYVRNDSPTARRRAQETHQRLYTGGPLLPTWMAPGAQPGTTRPVTSLEMASARQGLAAYETNGVKGFAAFIGLLGLGCFALAWAGRDTLGVALFMVVMGILLAVVAALTPGWRKRWYEKNRRLVELYDQQRAGQVGPPPPPPPGPVDRRGDERGGQ